MTVSRYNLAPRHLQDEMQQVFNRFFGDAEADHSNVVTSQWMPRVDIRENADAFLIQADVPGVEPGDIEIDMDKGMLSIRGERQFDDLAEGESLSRTERTRGSFYRRFSLPDAADAAGISAEGKHGVLTIRIPKKPETKPRRINVSS